GQRATDVVGGVWSAGIVAGVWPGRWGRRGLFCRYSHSSGRRKGWSFMMAGEKAAAALSSGPPVGVETVGEDWRGNLEP
ncbi:hypothetical protein CRG98_001538, partial [Punica granatum]